MYFLKSLELPVQKVLKLLSFIILITMSDLSK